MAVSSYGSSTDSSGVVRILKDLDASIGGRNVLIVEDIIDSGLTLHYLLKNLDARGPESLEVCALLTKPERRRVENCRSATSASRSRTGSRSATGWTSRSATATSPTWPQLQVKRRSRQLKVRHALRSAPLVPSP